MDTKTLSPRTRTSPCASPEFEFWMVRNPSFPQPNILSADQLIVDGVLLPLHLVNKSDPPQPPPEPVPPPTDSASKRWKDIFRKSEKKTLEVEESEKGKKKEKKSGGGGSASAELNINIWPFSRSRSAGNGGMRPKLFGAASRKANSAPCSRSNSGGESKSRKWSSSPGRAGVHLGRSSPVWQVRRSKNPEPDKSKRESRRSKVCGGGSAKTRVLNLNVPMCIGYRHHLTCRSDENSAIGVSNNNPGLANVGGKLFTLRSLFTKKSVVTSH